MTINGWQRGNAMIEPHILLNDLPGKPQVILDKTTGVLRSADGEVVLLRGCVNRVEGRIFSLYAEGGTLMLQLGVRRWPLDGTVPVNYTHDFSKKSTTFSIGDYSVEYEAWWAWDPTYNKFAPERDEDEDPLAYVYALLMDRQRRGEVVKRWNA